MPITDAAAMRRYEAARDALVVRMKALEALLSGDDLATVADARMHLQSDTFVLAVVGEFSSGKSFLLNALLGRFRFQKTGDRQVVAGLLATDINPSTATITELTYAPQDAAYAHYEGDRVERIALDRLATFVANDEDAPNRVAVQVDSPFLQRGFTVADTPGLASVNPAHRRATLRFLPNADAVLYLIDTQQPFSEGDASFLGIIRQHIDSIFIVQTKIDLWMQEQSDGKRAWEHAYERIASFAAVHAPGTYVYALSALEYARGVLDQSPQEIARSRFPAFLEALDASLIKNTGRARLRRGAERAGTAAAQARAQIERDLQMLALEPGSLRARRDAALAQIGRMESAIAAQRKEIERVSGLLRETIESEGARLADEMVTALERTFDSADVARLRDRARLHLLVDRTTARNVTPFAQQVATAAVERARGCAERAGAITPLHFSLTEAAAGAFGGDPASNLWSGDAAKAIESTIVLEAIGGPAIALAHDIGARFAAVPAGRYMKRELGADLRATIFPHFHQEIVAFAGEVAHRASQIYSTLGGELSDALARRRESEIGSIDRALAARASRGDVPAMLTELRNRDARIAGAVCEVDGCAGEFLAHGEEIAPADAGPEAVRRAHLEQIFDREAYGHGLRPTRWRVSVLGGLRRGKSSLINAFAGHRVLADESAGALAYPVHVRYGENEAAFALDSGGDWREVELESALDEATRNPVLITTPWKLPHELVLVHAPAFDMGDPMAEDICMVTARASSEVLFLFSRQLSGRELELCERIADLGKPILFVHTIADNETAAERRNVVELAQRYLRERNVETSRIFTVSTLEYAQAKREHRAPAGWNELDALISTLESHAESHMARLARLAAATNAARSPQPAPAPAGKPERGSLLTRLFGR